MKISSLFQMQWEYIAHSVFFLPPPPKKHMQVWKLARHKKWYFLETACTFFFRINSYYLSSVIPIIEMDM